MNKILPTKKNAPSTSDEYLSIEMLKLEFALNYILGTLTTLLDLLLVGQNKSRKVASIGQAIIQAARSVSTINLER